MVGQMRPLLDPDALERSPVVANNAMSRDRVLDGVNSYARELGFRPLDVLTERAALNGASAWLDLCCGSARALAEAANVAGDEIAITGVDLVDFFDPATRHAPGLELVTASLTSWQPDRSYDLITCVHGLHYVGDKLGALATVLACLKPGGRFAAHLDFASIRLLDGPGLERTVRQRLRSEGVDYDPKRRLITCVGPRQLRLPYVFVGADDAAGANYTGQPAVDSYYRGVR